MEFTGSDSNNSYSAYYVVVVNGGIRGVSVVFVVEVGGR
jgi:hypothetical protein